MPRVWVAHPVKDDLSAASTWGEVAYFNSRYVYPDELSDAGELPTGFSRNIISKVKTFDPDFDVFMLVGDLVQICAISSWLARSYPRFKILRYDRQAGGYVMVEMPGQEKSHG